MQVELCSFPVGGLGSTPTLIEYVPVALLMVTFTVAFDSSDAVPSMLRLPSSTKLGCLGSA
jgi:hypothetical protein